MREIIRRCMNSLLVPLKLVTLKQKDYEALACERDTLAKLYLAAPEQENDNSVD